MNREIIQALRDLSVPVNNLGYEYLKEAISLCLENKMLVYETTSILYINIAEIYSTTPSKVERAIRHAIEVSYSIANHKMLQKYINIATIEKKPTNSQFIASLVETIRLDMEDQK